MAGLYEVFEWLYAVSSDPTAGAAVLGSQGDVWDAQKDILSDTLGALAALVLYMLIRPVRLTPEYLGQNEVPQKGSPGTEL